MASLEAQRRARRKYKKSTKGKAAEARYDQSEKGRLTRNKIARIGHFKRNYGMTLEDYDILLKRQGGHCALCPKTPAQERYGKLAVDHDHTKKKNDPGFIRGLLCFAHNRAIGVLGDNEASLAQALAYVRGKLWQVSPTT